MWILPEKTESGVVYRGDRMEAFVSVPFEPFARLISEAIGKGIDVKEILRGRVGPESVEEKP